MGFGMDEEKKIYVQSVINRLESYLINLLKENKMTTNKLEYDRNYQKMKYKKDSKHRKYILKMANLRSNALIILRNMHKKEFNKIYNKLKQEEKK